MMLNDPFGKAAGYPASLKGTPAISRGTIVPTANTKGRNVERYGDAMKERVVAGPRRGNRDGLGRFKGKKPAHGHGSKLVTVGKAEIPATQVRSVTALLPTGKHVSHANDLEHFTRMKGYSGLPPAAHASRLGHYRKGRDKAARAFKGK